MPWSESEYYRAICDGCGAATRSAEVSGKNALHLLGAYCPRRSASEVIFCPVCIMTKKEATGGKASHSMTWQKARQLFQEHWHSPAEALELGYTVRDDAHAAALSQPAGPEPPEPARRAATSAPPPPTAPLGLPHSAEPAAEPLDLGGLPLRQLADAPGSVDNLRNAELDNLQNAELEPRLRRLEEENLAGRLEVVEASLREALERVASLEKQVAELQWWAEAAS